MMLDKSRSNSIMLSTYNLEKRDDGWYFWRVPFFTAEAESKGPYGSIMSACMMIATQATITKTATQVSIAVPEPACGYADPAAAGTHPVR